MRLNQLTAVMIAAATTMALVLAVAWPERLAAIDDAHAAAEIRPIIPVPTLELEGLVVKLTLDQTQYAAGDQPEILLDVANPTADSIETQLWLGMTASGVRDMLSRAPVPPTYFWNHQQDLAVAAGETLRVRLQTGKQLEADKTITVTMSGAGQPRALATPLLMNREVQDRQRPTLLPGPQRGEIRNGLN